MTVRYLTDARTPGTRTYYSVETDNTAGFNNNYKMYNVRIKRRRNIYRYASVYFWAI